MRNMWVVIKIKLLICDIKSSPGVSLLYLRCSSFSLICGIGFLSMGLLFGQE